MTDREKVIRGLECRSNNATGRDCENCPYGMQMARRWGCDFMKLAYDALTLVKGQEPRVMTREEYCAWCRLPDRDRRPVVIEDRSTGGMVWVWYAAVSQEHDRTAYRVWTGWPTDEQREVEIWQE